MLQKLSKCEEGLTLLKFDDFTTTQILREIKFWWIETVKNVIFCNFDFGQFDQFYKAQIP